MEISIKINLFSDSNIHKRNKNNCIKINKQLTTIIILSLFSININNLKKLLKM